MSSYPPPTYVVPIYNPAYFASSTEGLTIGEASGIFLNKTSPDIATALETFNAGINTNNITPTTTASTLSLNSSKTGSTNADPCIAIATSSGITRTIKIGREGGTNPNSVHLAGLDITNTGLNNITGTTGDISIGNLQTDGVLNLGTGALRSTTGVINIGNSASLNKISIETSNTGNGWNTPAISIGGEGSATKTIKIGTQTNSVVVSSLNLQTASINNLSPLVGGIQIANGQRDGGLDIATGQIRTAGAVVNICNTNGCLNTINVLNGGASTAGTFNLASNGANSTVVNIGSATSTGNFNLNTCGTINIGTDNTTVANTINIGATSTVISQVFCRATFTQSRAFTCSALFTVNGNANFGSTITLQSSTTPTQDTMLGGKRSATILTTAPVNGSIYGSMTLTQAGTYLFNFGITQPITVLGTTNYVNLGGANTVTNNYGATEIITGTQLGFNGSQVVTCTATTYTLTLSTNSTCSIALGYFTATRIG